jgi:hypothetical protein
MRSARQDIRTLESGGYSAHEALEFVTRRAVAEARQMTQQASGAYDRRVLEDHLAYLEELRAICLATLRRGTVMGNA